MESGKDKENSNTEAEKVLEQKQRNYDRAITLVQNQVQLFWLVFSAFLLSETVFLGSIASAIKDSTNIAEVLVGAIFGFLICAPWWTSFKYNHAFYRLRIYEAKQYEQDI